MPISHLMTTKNSQCTLIHAWHFHLVARIKHPVSKPVSNEKVNASYRWLIWHTPFKTNYTITDNSWVDPNTNITYNPMDANITSCNETSHNQSACSCLDCAPWTCPLPRPTTILCYDSPSTKTKYVYIGVYSNTCIKRSPLGQRKSVLIRQVIDIKYTIKPAHGVTSIKQSPVLKGHIFLSVIESIIWIKPLLRGHLSYKNTFYVFQLRCKTTN
jgi:hypothetical protein